MNPPSTAAASVPLRRIDDLPGPRGLPLVGNLFQVHMATIHRDMERWAREYGAFFKVRLGPRRMLVVADHEAIQAILRDRPDGFRRGSRLREIGVEMGGMPGLFSAEGESWRNQRRMVMASFAPHHIRAYFPSLLKVTLRLQQRWQKAAHAGTTIDLQADLKRFTVDAIAGLAFGAEVNTLESGDEDLIQRHLDIVLAGLYRRIMSPFPYWRWFRLPADRQIERSNTLVRESIQRFVREARERMAADRTLFEHPRNLLEAMIAAAEEGDAGLDDRDVAGNVSTMLFAGEDTTANTLAWMIWLLYRNPPALSRAQQEVRGMASDPRGFTLEQLDSLDYLEACAHEAMRLEPVAPFLGMEALRDSSVAGIGVPARTTVWCVLRHDSVDERHFANAQAFEPERWLNRSDSTAGPSGRRVAMPFGSGPRICPGRYLALLEVKLAMAMLLGGFEIERVDTPDRGEAREVMHFTMNPVGLSMRLTERGSSPA